MGIFAFNIVIYLRKLIKWIQSAVDIGSFLSKTDYKTPELKWGMGSFSAISSLIDET